MWDCWLAVLSAPIGGGRARVMRKPIGSDTRSLRNKRRNRNRMPDRREINYLYHVLIRKLATKERIEMERAQMSGSRFVPAYPFKITVAESRSGDKE